MNLATLGLPTTPKPDLKKPYTAPAPHFMHHTYAAHILAQMLESTAQKVEAGSKFFQHTGLHKRAGRLYSGAESLLVTLFGDFSADEATMLNHLTNTCDAKLNRVHDLLTELAEIAGIKAE
jgi:hypothetical protein